MTTIKTLTPVNPPELRSYDRLLCDCRDYLDTLGACADRLKDYPEPTPEDKEQLCDLYRYLYSAYHALREYNRYSV